MIASAKAVADAVLKRVPNADLWKVIVGAIVLIAAMAFVAKAPSSPSWRGATGCR